MRQFSRVFSLVTSVFILENLFPKAHFSDIRSEFSFHIEVKIDGFSPFTTFLNHGLRIFRSWKSENNLSVHSLFPRDILKEE